MFTENILFGKNIISLKNILKNQRILLNYKKCINFHLCCNDLSTKRCFIRESRLKTQITNNDLIRKLSINSRKPTNSIKIENVKTLNHPYLTNFEQKKRSYCVNVTKLKSSLTSCNADSNLKFGRIADTNKFTSRTHNCGELRKHDIGKEVIVCGWVEFQRMNKFLVLRDGYGKVQVMVPSSFNDDIETSNIPFESIVKVVGTVVPRPEDMVNPSMTTGDIEIEGKEVIILNKSRKNLPMEVRNFNRAKETIRLENRYIDLRFSDMQRNLRTRSSILMRMREYLINYLGFVEVETPTLFRRTPGGAQEFIVPTRKPGYFYSLVQSPQQFKQMLMVGAIDRYFQIARCYRDEATRPDRQPEFTQLDIELSFTSKEDIMQLIEETLSFCWPAELSEIKIPFKRITYEESMCKYGSDKPDTRFDLILNDFTSSFDENNKLKQSIKDFAAYAIVAKKRDSYITNSLKKKMEKIGEEFSACKLLILSSKNINESQNLKNLLTSNVCSALQKDLNLDLEDIAILAYGPKQKVQTLLGRIRLLYMENLEDNNKCKKRANNIYNFLWVTDFPLFVKNDETNILESAHHPFTAPSKDDVQKLSDPKYYLSIRSQAYDLVLNGQEIGGGSIRIHDHNIQKQILDNILKIDHSHLKHLLDALQSGCPPHGGIALGIDRLISIMCDATMRDVIAFPKGLDGKDHLSKAPVPITDAEKDLYSIEIKNIKKI